MKNLIVIIALVICGSLSAQVSIQGGPSMLLGFGNPRPFGGFHIGLEIPRDDAVSIFGKYTHHFKQKGETIDAWVVSKDQVNIPPAGYSILIEAVPSMNYHIIEGGTRYYLGNGFDYGFAAYGGTSLMLVFNQVKGEYSPFDEVNYEIDANSRTEGSIFSIGFGLGGGVKYSTARMGTFYMDLGVAYMLFSQPSNSSVGSAVFSEQNRQWSSLIFNLNVGYRKDILW